MTRPELERIVAAANTAPSADNCQPWVFTWNGESLAIGHDPERATHVLDHRKRMSCLSLGCLVEALIIGAAREGLVARFELTPGEPGAIWAQARFERGGSAHELDDALERRCTDRRAFQGGSLAAPVFDAIQRDAAAAPGCEVRFLARCPPELLDYLFRGDAYVWRHEDVYRDLMSWVRFSEREIEATGDGAPWRCLGYDIPELPGLSIARSSLVQRLIAGGGLSVLPRLRLRSQLASSAGVYAVTAPSTSPLDLVRVGRLAFRCWLRLNRAGYGVQPISVQSVFAHSFAEGQPPKGTLPEFIELFRGGPDILARAFGASEGERVIWMFRTGISPAPPPQLRTRRLPVARLLRWAVSGALTGSSAP
ncbi:MAG: hypothetical protein ABJE95_22235 [Byssovorax sp.]